MSTTRLPFYRQLSIKLTTAYLTVTIAILAGIAIFSIQFSKKGYEQLTLQQFQSTLQVNESFIEQLSLATTSWSQHMAAEPEMKSFFLINSLEIMTTYLREYESAGLMQYRTLLLNSKGELIFDLNHKLAVGTQLGTTELIREAYNNKQTSNSILHDENDFTLFSASPVMLNEELIGFILIGKELDHAFIQQVARATGIEITIVRDRAVMVSTMMKDAQPIRELPIPYLEYQMLLDAPGESVVRTLFGATYFVSAKPLKKMDGSLPGSIMLAKSHNEMDSVLDKILENILNISFIGILATFLLGGLVYYYLANIRKLTLATVNISKSGVIHPVNIQSTDEIGILAKNFNLMLNSIDNKNKQLKEYSNTLEDKVSERTLQLQSAIMELKKFSLAVEQSTVSIVITDLVGNIEYSNPKFSELTGYSLDELVGKNINILKSGLTSDEDYENLWQTIRAGKVWHGEFKNRRKDGALYWDRTGITPIVSDNNEVTHFLAVKEDISDFKLYEKALLKQAHYDALTSLPNRLLAQDRLTQLIASCKRSGNKGALMFIDLDHFKQINDTLGHHIGDKLLIKAAERISSCIRAEDTAARLSGDEFLVMITGLSNDYNAETVAQNIIKNLCQSVTLEKHNVVITASIGIAMFPEDSINITDLMRYADTAMYKAKSSGRNKYCLFSKELVD